MKVVRTQPFNIRWGYYSKLASRNISKTVRRMISDGKWAIISAQKSRGYHPETGAKIPAGIKKDKDAHGRLKDLLQQHGIGFIDQQVGYWGPDESDPTAPKFPEDTLFIPNISFEMAIKIGRKFTQAQIIYGNKGKYAFYNVSDGSLYGEVKEVKTHFEHLTDPIKPGFNPNYTDSDGEKWRLADPDQHLHKKKDFSIDPPAPEVPAVLPGEKAPLLASSKPILTYDAASPTHFFYAWDFPFKLGSQADVVSAYTTGNWPAHQMMAWLPLIKE